MDLHLKFKDKAEADSVLYTQVPIEWDDEGKPTAWDYQPNYRDIDTIGIVYENGLASDGWHVNVRTADEDVALLDAYKIEVVSPLRVWA